VKENFYETDFYFVFGFGSQVYSIHCNGKILNKFEVLMEQKFEKIDRTRVEAIEEVLGQEFRVLDDGFVRVIDYLGSDESIVQAARVSYGKGTKKRFEDRGLIRYLMRHHHTSPFEMCEIKLHVRVPMDTWRQWIRHRTANVNEYSTRYSIAIDAAQKTSPDEWRLQGVNNRQGSEGFVDLTKGSYLTKRESEVQELSRSVYNERLELGVAREQARKDLPLSTYTEAYWKLDLHNLLNFLRLRMEEHAQYEIRTYANTIGQEIVKRWCPLVWEAFLDYSVFGEEFSRMELAVLAALSNNEPDLAFKLLTDFGLLEYRDGKKISNLERLEFETKLEKLKIKIPW